MPEAVRVLTLITVMTFVPQGRHRAKGCMKENPALQVNDCLAKNG